MVRCFVDQLDEATARKLAIINQRCSTGSTKQAIDTARFILQSKISWTGESDIKKLLQHSRSCKSSDVRDCVYAFVGLASPNYGIIPDYSPSKSPSDVLLETTQRIITHEDSLEIILYALDGPKTCGTNLPSWVGDWTTALVLGPNRWRPLANAMHGTKAGASFQLCPHTGALRLLVTGILFDSLSHFRTRGHGHGRWKSEEFTVETNGLAFQSDEIWFLYGAKAAVVLRPQGCNYVLISEAEINRRTKSLLDIEISLDKIDCRNKKSPDLELFLSGDVHKAVGDSIVTKRQISLI